MMPQKECYLILGGAGLVGKQIAHRIATDNSLSPRKIVIASLYAHELENALAYLHNAPGDTSVEWVGEHGNIFVRNEYADENPKELLVDSEHRETLFADLYDDIEEAYKHSRLVSIIRRHRPDVIIDSINTATAISYQNLYTASNQARKQIHEMIESVRSLDVGSALDQTEQTSLALYELLLSQSLPELIRHVLLLNKAMVEVGTRLYLKIGTTGTGGMGLNIPYTHSEDKPSAQLITKTAVAFAHTGLLFLMARTAGGPIVKEIKPGGLIGYADVTCRKIPERGKRGTFMYRYTSKTEWLDEYLELLQPEDMYHNLGVLELPIIDTGENGLFTKGEFETITALGQMEFITPEEIAHEVAMEIQGSTTGRDVIAAIDGAVMNPTYRAGYLRHRALTDLERLEAETSTHSVALGHLGPPELSKLLWEAELLKLRCETLRAVLKHTPDELSEELAGLIQSDEFDQMCQTIISLGLPILLPDGTQIIRGPRIRIPERIEPSVRATEEDVDAWAQRGWVDLRPLNMALWQQRFEKMEKSRQDIRGRGSAAVTIEGYIYDNIRIGEVVGWIFNNEQDGYRIKYGHRIK
ncbi:MAG TPA: hypothetical protein VNW73_17730 [Ktedonobacteraceae bacterium]|jgi:hypothetical protein|nr:hypothetical protein [Ktedonobacteraceae bacterium]